MRFTLELICYHLGEFYLSYNFQLINHLDLAN